MKNFVLGVLGLAALAVVGYGLFLWGGYDTLNTRKQNKDGALANIAAMEQRRFDLLPNLVKTVKGYASHEKGTFTAVAEAQAKIGQINFGKLAEDPEGVKKLQAASQELSGALSKLLAISTSQPDLKADKSFLELQSQIEGSENRIAVARTRYNEDAKLYNNAVTGYFLRRIAADNGFEKAPYFAADPASKKAPEVSFE
jgi:LemA protein